MNSLMNWLLPFWIIGVPVLLVLLDHMRGERSTSSRRDRVTPQRTGTPDLAFR